MIGEGCKVGIAATDTPASSTCRQLFVGNEHPVVRQQLRKGGTAHAAHAIGHDRSIRLQPRPDAVRGTGHPRLLGRAQSSHRPGAAGKPLVLAGKQCNVDCF